MTKHRRLPKPLNETEYMWQFRYTIRTGLVDILAYDALFEAMVERSKYIGIPAAKRDYKMET